MAAPLHSPDEHYAHIATERNSASLDETLLAFERGPLAAYMPYNENTASILRGLADLKPATLATMHGTSFAGDGERALLDLTTVFGRRFRRPSSGDRDGEAVSPIEAASSPTGRLAQLA